MRPFEKSSLLFWGLALLLAASYLAYVVHYWGVAPVWDFIHFFGHGAGWAGTAAMGLSLLYIPRKKKWFTFGPVRTWYKLHVAFGLTGPILIIVHAYGKFYGFGALALALMSLVLGTGIIGHYLFRRLPDEVKHRTETRPALLDKLVELEADIKAREAEADDLRSELDSSGLMSRLAEASGKLARPTLAKDPAKLKPLIREYWGSIRAASSLRKKVKGLASAERLAADLRAQELLELMDLERGVRDLAALYELFSLWRKLHVPMSWLMWWTAALHVWGWWYY